MRFVKCYVYFMATKIITFIADRNHLISDRQNDDFIETNKNYL